MWRYLALLRSVSWFLTVPHLAAPDSSECFLPNTSSPLLYTSGASRWTTVLLFSWNSRLRFRSWLELDSCVLQIIYSETHGDYWHFLGILVVQV